MGMQDGEWFQDGRREEVGGGREGGGCKGSGEDGGESMSSLTLSQLENGKV